MLLTNRNQYVHKCASTMLGKITTSLRKHHLILIGVRKETEISCLAQSLMVGIKQITVYELLMISFGL